MLKKLKEISTLIEFATLLGIKPKGLSYILYVVEEGSKYSEFEIPKKSGGIRKIQAPIPQLKKVQSRLSKLLFHCYAEIDKKLQFKHNLSHGFTKNCSILTNAYEHRNRRHVFNVDILNYFPTFNFGRVRGFFIRNNHFELKPKIATIIAQIACYKNELPQGSPCSPIISNLIGHLIDIRMVYLAKKSKCTYTRYADDLTFSTNKKIFPKSIGILKVDTGKEWQPGILLLKEISKVGFELNLKKTSLQSKTNRQVVTGIVVNKGINVKREYYKTARAMCNSLFTTNSFYILEKKKQIPENQLNSKEANCKIPGTLNQLEGILSFIYLAKTFEDKRNLKRENRCNFFHPPNFIKIYREFIYYKKFFINNKPTIICEGKTDAIYLMSALKKLESTFNKLIKKEETKYCFNVSFVNFTQNFKQIVSKSEGTSGIKNILKEYSDQLTRFKGAGLRNPVIVILDNDKGAKEIVSEFKITNKQEPIINLFKNLYIAFIPEAPGNCNNEIEDLFDKETLNVKIDGKSFNPSAKLNSRKEYGKIIFAEKVIHPNWSTINFDNFKPIFTKFEEIIKYHEQKK